MTVAHVYTVAFQGIEAREVDVQVHIGDSGGGQFNVVGLTKPSTGEMVAEFLPGARIIRAFNTSSYANFAREAGRPAPRMGPRANRYINIRSDPTEETCKERCAASSYTPL